jgi:hypothetical protein
VLCHKLIPNKSSALVLDKILIAINVHHTMLKNLTNEIGHEKGKPFYGCLHSDKASMKKLYKVPECIIYQN